MHSLGNPVARPGEAIGTLLRLEGRDALPFLHRISTQALDDLGPGQARPTLFCDPRGRLLHRAWVAATSDRAVWLVRDDAPSLPLAEFLERFIFREEVRLGVPRQDWSVHALPVDPEDPAAAEAPGTVREQGGMPREIRTRPDWKLALAPPDTPAPGGALERARILAGLPRHGHEIAESFTPYEVGLAQEVHLRKGCYTGQEALLRMVTYKSVRRRLVRVSAAGPPPGVPHELVHGGEVAGWVTSAAAEMDPRRGPGWIGLAVVRLEACEPGFDLTADARPVTIAHAFEMLPPLGLS